MRPVRIEVEGFFAYRERAVVDLEGVDYFALEGPTGAGKSSLIDAMIFALYGRVPRLGGGTVAPAISAGTNRARVSFTFLVGNTTYTATRQLERTATGARATEVRLETEDEVIASGSSETAEAVSSLLRLSYEDFTRTVVLPQGEFSRFLTSTPRERQELLRGLLGLDIYRTMHGLAREREQRATAQLEVATNRLNDLAVPDDDERQSALDLLGAMEKLSTEIESRETAINDLAAAADQAQIRLDEVRRAGDRLGELAAPPRLEELSGRIAELDDLIDSATASLALIDKEGVELASKLADLPRPDALDRFAELHQRRRVIDEELAEIDLPTLEESLRSAEESVGLARSGHKEAGLNLEAARAGHAAHELAVHLASGDVCPVCQQAVNEPPAVAEAADLDESRTRLAEASATLEDAREVVGRISAELAANRSAAEKLQDNRKTVDHDLADAPEPGEIEKLRVEVSEANAQVDALARQRSSEVKALAKLEEERAALAEQQRSLGILLMGERDKVSDLRPPIAQSEDVLVQWKELLQWREAKAEEMAASVVTMEKTLEDATTKLEGARRGLADDLARLGVEVRGSAAVSVARAEETARGVVRRHQEADELAGKLGDEIKEAGDRAAIAAGLVRHLRSDGFERWMMAGAMVDLVAGANTILGQLSESSYSLHSDDEGSFDVVDHRNADEIRPVATLSGGETFLVSLALALSLAETLSARGGADLDAIILDEGFGSLDEESLEVVAAVLESLSTGLMVGTITHVRALAARAPVRFLVTKGPEGSRIKLAEE